MTTVLIAVVVGIVCFYLGTLAMALLVIAKPCNEKDEVPLGVEAGTAHLTGEHEARDLA